MKVVVIGANGHVGTEVVAAFQAVGDEVVPLTHADVEISDKQNVLSKLVDYFDVLVNSTCIGTRDSDAYPEKAYLVNALGPKHLAEAAKRHNALFVHISTDQVFDGKKTAPYTETDAPGPISIYGNTKLSGEYFALYSGAKVQVLRTSALYGHTPTRNKKGGFNFAQLMMKLAREDGFVQAKDDERITATYTNSLAKQMVVLSRTEHQGLFHAVSSGTCTWYEWAEEVFRLTNTNVRLEAVKGGFDGLIRPKYLAMESARLTNLGLNVFKPWKEELSDYLKVI